MIWSLIKIKINQRKINIKKLFLDSTDSSSDIISSTTKYGETDIINVIEAFDNQNFKVVMNVTKLNLTNNNSHVLELQKKTFNEKFINFCYWIEVQSWK